MLFDMHPTPFTCLLLNYIDLSILDDLGLQTLGVLDVDGLDVGVKLLLGTLLVVTLTGDANTEAERNALDTRLPDLLVELGVEADIVGAHSLRSESTDLLDSPGGPLLEAHTMNSLVKVDGVFAGDNIGDGATAGLASRLLGA